MVLIIKTGSTLPHLKALRGDFEDWIRAGMGLAPLDLVVVDVTDGREPPRPDQYAGVVITGSHDMVSERRAWSERTASWLRRAVHANVPTLGVCYGHQLLAHALGGRVDYNPRGTEMGTREITLLEPAAHDPLLRGLPRTLKAHESHAQAVLQLPPGAVVLAASEQDAHQAFRVGELAWGVQFHPEFDSEIMRTYCENDDPEARAEIEETPHAAEVLRRFAAIINSGQGTAGRTPS